MITKNDIIQKAYDLGFADIGFTDAAPFDSHKDALLSRREEYAWAEAVGLKLLEGSEPLTVYPEAKTIIVLIENYFRESFPPSMEGNFGRCYMNDDRATKDGLVLRIKAFRDFLRDNGLGSMVPMSLPHRAAAARAGLGTIGKNCLFFSRRVARQGSWVFPITVVVNKEYEPDPPTMELGCPDWCRNACIAACPTRALKGNCAMDPRICISFLSYFGSGITPLELREPMGMYVYGCDICQNVCPRNRAWLSRELPVNQKTARMADDFRLERILHMDAAYFQTRVWPYMFYMSVNDMWRWKMNAARAMGNSLDEKYIPELVRAYEENDDYRVTGMAAWALGRIGGSEARNALIKFRDLKSDMSHGEVLQALRIFE